jgi:hypothetical protein
MKTNLRLVNGGSRIEYTTKETAVAIRAALKAAFAGQKFSVTTSYASMTSSTHIAWTDGPTEKEVERVTDRFTSKSFNGSDDSTHYHEQQVDGQRVQYSGWVTTRRNVSAALLQKALDRYNVERAAYGVGPAALTVKDGSYPHVEGPDATTLNPCGGRATWCPDGVYQFASQMRANGCVVKMKEDRW